MVVGPRRAMSPSSVFRPLQNIYSPSCRWKDNSPLVHRRSVTKKEWISPLMSQRIKERGTYMRTEVYINRSPGGEKVRTQWIPFTPTKHNFSYLPGLFVLTLASEVPWQAPHRCNIAPIVFFRIRTHKDDPILDDLIWLTIRASSVWRCLWGRLLFDA